MTAYDQIEVKYHKTVAGELILGSYQGKLCLCDWRYRSMREDIDDRIQRGLAARYIEGESDTIQRTILQLQEYFLENRREFTIPLLLIGTDFQKQVWEALQKIPFGETRSYLELSRALGNEKAIRAVAAANGANALSILVPCHRIIGSKGELTGYAGGLQAKNTLLKLEAKGRGNEQLELF